jgi:hypothetical protein
MVLSTHVAYVLPEGTHSLYASSVASPVEPMYVTLRHRIRVHLANRNYYSHSEFCTKLEELMEEDLTKPSMPNKYSK